MTSGINADRGRRALVHGAQLAWVASPEAGVARRMLERIGGEVALASTIVRYAPGSRFHEHVHEFGEEFIVLEGTFSDGDGDYPKGTYVRNPGGTRHSPSSRDGCVIFVKLRQMQADEPERVRVFVADRQWVRIAGTDLESCLLYDNGRTTVALERMAPGCRLPVRATVGGEELFVLSGSLLIEGDESAALEPWSWLRQPGAGSVKGHSEKGATWWVKRGHLP